MTARQAIACSIAQNTIVHIDHSYEERQVLLARCDDYVDADEVSEFWGTTESGEDWRVHVRSSSYYQTEEQ